MQAVSKPNSRARSRAASSKVSHVVAAKIRNDESRAANSLKPNTRNDNAVSQVESAGFAQNGRPRSISGVIRLSQGFPVRNDDLVSATSGFVRPRAPATSKPIRRQPPPAATDGRLFCYARRM